MVLDFVHLFYTQQKFKLLSPATAKCGEYIIMTDANLATGEGLKTKIDKITAILAKNAAAGSAGLVIVVNADNDVLVSEGNLREVLGDIAYDTLAANALTAANTALAAAKVTAQTAFDALGV